MLALIGVVTVGSLVLGIALAVFGTKVSRAPISDANAYSRSAVGHQAFVELLRRLKVPVVISQHDSAKKAGKGAVLILAEPRPSREDIARARRQVEEASTVIVVLPKWGSSPDKTRPEWIGNAGILPAASVRAVAQEILAVDVEIVRGVSLGPVTRNKLGPAPSLRYPQLMRSEGIDPIVRTESGILLGSVETWAGKEVWVLSDPDVLSTHGIGQGSNAHFAVTMVEHLRSGTGAVVFDETVHGFSKKPSVWRALVEFPLVIASLQVLCATLLLLWAAVGRFGTPQPPRPAIEPGKRFLINNTAALLQFGGHTAHTLQRYYNSTVRDVARSLHAPDVDDSALEAWLERVGQARGVRTSLADLRREISAVTESRRVNTRSIVLAANRLYHWKQEMLHGSASHPRPS